MQISGKRVFISSTTEDLAEYRKAARDAIMEAEAYPVMMDYWPADDNDAVTLCMSKVDASDIYIGIFAHRYGFCPNSGQISITEMEFDRATLKKLRRLCFLVDPKMPWLPEHIDDEPNKSRLRKFKSEKIDKQLIRKTFTTSDSLKSAISSSLIALSNSSEGPQTEPVITSIETKNSKSEQSTAPSTIGQNQLGEVNQSSYTTSSQVALIHEANEHVPQVEAASVTSEKSGEQEQNGDKKVTVVNNPAQAEPDLALRNARLELLRIISAHFADEKGKDRSIGDNRKGDLISTDAANNLDDGKFTKQPESSEEIDDSSRSVSDEASSLSSIISAIVSVVLVLAALGLIVSPFLSRPQNISPTPAIPSFTDNFDTIAPSRQWNAITEGWVVSNGKLLNEEECGFLVIGNRYWNGYTFTFHFVGTNNSRFTLVFGLPQPLPLPTNEDTINQLPGLRYSMSGEQNNWNIDLAWQENNVQHAVNPTAILAATDNLQLQVMVQDRRLLLQLDKLTHDYTYANPIAGMIGLYSCGITYDDFTYLPGVG